jgi:hypothetical protein
MKPRTYPILLADGRTIQVTVPEAETDYERDPIGLLLANLSGSALAIIHAELEAYCADADVMRYILPRVHRAGEVNMGAEDWAAELEEWQATYAVEGAATISQIG